VASIEWPPDQVEAETREHAGAIARKKKKRIVARLKTQLDEAESSGNHEKAEQILEEIKSYSN
jgi:hypothetical protein